ncbi:hypothetical protein [Pedobacter paludis]|uniref:Uncharacterized protein n=1 Tax=Pedobacter paludis TaxID=2203212 RepID=A0A317EZC1_9SPHI|nr:hypothetical protein [Pedobacter paludis]PWS32251.1 hypothetical protein DF947_10815 [Pedobacter paludis]
MKYFILWLTIALPVQLYASPPDTTIRKIPDRYLSEVNAKTRTLEQDLNRRTKKALDIYIKEQTSIQEKLARLDPASDISKTLSCSIDSLKRMRESLLGKVKRFVPFQRAVTGNSLDSLQNVLGFLGDNSALVNGKEQITSALKNIENVKSELQRAGEVQNYVKQTMSQITGPLEKYRGLSKNLNNISLESFYFNGKVAEYTNCLRDADKAKRMAMSILQKNPAFMNFMAKNTYVNGIVNLFLINESRSIDGLQTRDMVDNFRSQLQGTGADAAGIVAGRQQIADRVIDKAKKYLNLKDAGEIPTNEPNEMKNKKFLKRLELGYNLQPTRGSKYFPSMYDIAVQAAYKLSKKGSIGFGAYYKLGLGAPIKNISFSHRGFGIRAFAEYQLRGVLFFNAGIDLDRTNPFKAFTELYRYSSWKCSGLAGLGLKLPTGNKSKQQLMLLCDLTEWLDYRSKGIPLKMRIGQTF